MKSTVTVRGVITMSVIMLLLSAGFIFYSYDKDDSNVKILNEDELSEVYPIVSDSYTPSQNLLISQGKFKKAGESIRRMNG